AIRVRGHFRLQGGSDRFEDAFRVADYIVVPESQHTIAVFAQSAIANGIAWVLGVLPSVNLNHKLAAAADKINDVGSDRLLPYELAAGNRPRADAVPENLFCSGGVEAKPPHTLRFCVVGWTHGIRPLTRRASRVDLSPQAGRGDFLDQYFALIGRSSAGNSEMTTPP